ncbi:MAG TPA: CocE/NonD family hydrolase [Solirubrobacterales bacterium]|nr:CocE/NonD family hydrolase [Solirubrobacterales bacterium]
MGTEGLRRVLVTAAATLLGVLAHAPAAQAEFTSLYGGDAPCTEQAANGNVRLCGGETVTWDGQTQIDVNVILPPEPAAGADGPYPLIGYFHGWGGSKIGLGDPQVQKWAEAGYAVFSMSDRGWGKSCGKEDLLDLLTPACAAGYNHLMDSRYEVRDAQHLISILADEGAAQPRKIAATGVSYGGGLSLSLAALRDRTMLPDGSLVPWTSPKGTPMELAAAAPQWPWSDLAYSLMPNGRMLDYRVDNPYRGPAGNAPIGVMKASYVTGLFGIGTLLSNYALPGTDPDADLITWYGLISAGEPYDSNPLANSIVEEISAHHSPYALDHSQPPAPLLIQSGWNDDLFPVDEAIRFYNRTRAQYPADPISLFLSDDGHARSQNKPADQALFRARRDAWFDHYLKGAGPAPQSSAEALTTTCPKESASQGPYKAASWHELSPGEIRVGTAAAQTVLPTVATDLPVGQAFDPIAGQGACATASGADQPGTANHRLAVPAPGFTLLGSPTVIADLASGTGSQLAARLLDVAPDGNERLVARGLLRPGAGGADFVFQLHPQGYRFAGGHEVKLELLPSDAPYSRPSNAQGPITVSNLELRLPVLEQPGSLGGLVQGPAPPGRLPRPGDGARPGALLGAAGLAGRLRAARKAVRVPIKCVGGSCQGRLRLTAGKKRILTRGSYSLVDGTKKRLNLRLTKAGRRIVASRRQAEKRSFRIRIKLEDAGRPAPVELRRRLHLGRPLTGPRR